LKPVISLIVAASENGAIGRNNEMLWHLPDDFRWFKEKTLGHPVIMGRNTMLSLGRSLPKRRNIVISRNKHAVLVGFDLFHSLEEAIASASETDKEEIFIIGGGSVYEQALPFADRIYYTRVQANFPDAETFFHLPKDGWKLEYSFFHPIDESHIFPFTFEIWEKS
jgi:dihydrofolate reductase